MDIRLKSLILWPEQEDLQKTMPKCFQLLFGKKVAIIIDCFEIFLEQPSNLRARAATWSNYKHRNTAKVLLGILLLKRAGEDVPLIHRIVRVCCALSNVCNPIVPFD